MLSRRDVLRGDFVNIEAKRDGECYTVAIFEMCIHAGIQTYGAKRDGECYPVAMFEMYIMLKFKRLGRIK